MSQKRKSSLIREIVSSMVVLTMSATVLISATVIWTSQLPGGKESFTPLILILYILLFAVVIAIFGTLFLSRTIVQPLRKLVEATQKIAQGELATRIEMDTENEFAQLTEAFNKMAEELARKQNSLEQKLQELEKINRELRRTQDQLIISEKLASVGRLSAGIAHEIGNPLSIISGYLEIISKAQEMEAREKDLLSRVEGELNRINQIIRELLDYSRPPSGQAEFIDLNQIIKETLKLIELQKGFLKIKTRLNLRQNLPLVWVNRNHLKQVLINLFLNALDAMPDGGVLQINTFTPDFNSKEVMLEISDTGIGIPPEHLNKIFDPFFTTKEPRRGVGLGLSISLKLIETMNGNIEVESKPELGSTFRIKLKTEGGRSDSKT